MKAQHDASRSAQTTARSIRLTGLGPGFGGRTLPACGIQADDGVPRSRRGNGSQDAACGSTKATSHALVSCRVARHNGWLNLLKGRWGATPTCRIMLCSEMFTGINEIQITTSWDADQACFFGSAKSPGMWRFQPFSGVFPKQSKTTTGIFRIYRPGFFRHDGTGLGAWPRFIPAHG